MKNKSIITILSLCLGLSMATTSCEDMLTSDSNRHSYEVAGDTLYSYWGILQSLQNLGERYVILGECRGELIDGGEFTTDSVKALLSFGLNGDTENVRDGANRYLKVSDYYHVINSCNAYLAMADTTMNTAVGDRYMIREYAQVEAIRAWTYMQLVINYRDVPFYLEPMLSTNDINNFDSKKNRVNADNLWEKLEKKLIRAYQIEEQWGYPQYNSYGYKTSVCHSSKAMFPTSLVLADIYLMGNQYEKAAAYYYEFLDGEYGGALPSSYYSYAYLPLNASNPILFQNGTPWNETGATNKTQESITAIPSSKNSLWGTVQRGVNELYGFDATISQSTSSSDSTTTASIYLTRNWERQLGPSEGYDTLRLKQKFEVYVTAKFSDIDDESRTKLVVMDSVGDARGICSSFGNGYISRFNSGDYYVNETKTQRYIMKQNMGGTYSTVFPMVYRKSMVWLRFAEALNRAGYPSYAFAILKNGFTKNNSWLPADETDYETKEYRVYYQYTKEAAEGDEDAQPQIIAMPEDWETNPKCLITNKDYDYNQFKTDSTAFITYIKEELPIDLTAVEKPGDNIKYAKIETYANYIPEDNNIIVCNYINRKEWKKAQGLIWMDFNKSQFNGRSTLTVFTIPNYPMETESNMISMGSYPINISNTEYITRGIHQKGCGMLKYNERRSVYNYVDQINIKLEAAGKAKLTKNQIYDGTHDEDIKEAIEELILDEEALELAFEGSRFFDIMRVARRRANPGQYMVNKISSRRQTTACDFEVENLANEKNWYFPLPDNSNVPVPETDDNENDE